MALEGAGIKPAGIAETQSGAGSGDGFKLGSLVVDRFVVLGFIAFVLIGFSGGVTNTFIYSRVANYFGYAREIATFVRGCAFLAALLIVRFRPEFLYVRRTSVLFLVISVLFVPLTLLALNMQDPVLTTLALCCRACSGAWVLTLLVAVLVRTSDARVVPLAYALSLVIESLMGSLFPFVQSPLAASCTIAACLIVSIGLLTYPARPILNRVRASEPTELVELLHPGAFLNYSHGFFLCALLFSVASGFSMTFREVENAPIAISALAYVLLFVVMFVAMDWGQRQEDTLFSFSTVLVMAGFLLVPVIASFDSDASNTLIDIGENCFQALTWFMLASIGKRNLFAMLPAFGFVEFCGAVGTDIGAATGHILNSASSGNDQLTLIFSLSFAFILFVFLWVGFRDFSFTKVIHNLDSLTDAQVAAVPATLVAEGDVQERGIAQEAEEASEAGRVAEATEATEAGEAGEAGEVRKAGKGLGGGPGEGPAADSAADKTTSLPEASQQQSALEQRCAQVGAEHGLTAREQEIFAMLARGRNAGFIMDEFVLSRNTVKSHIKHIYVKLGVHSQQELIDLVE